MAPELRVRVCVEDVWDTVGVSAQHDWTIARLKAEALTTARGAAPLLDHYVVKYRGAQVLDEESTLGDLNIPENATLIVLAATRRPVR